MKKKNSLSFFILVLFIIMNVLNLFCTTSQKSIFPPSTTKKTKQEEENHGLILNTRITCSVIQQLKLPNFSFETCLTKHYNLMKQENTCEFFVSPSGKVFKVENILERLKENVFNLEEKVKQVDLNEEKANSLFNQFTAKTLRELFFILYNCKYTPQKIKQAINLLGKKINQGITENNLLKKGNIATFIKSLYLRLFKSNNLGESSSAVEISSLSELIVNMLFEQEVKFFQINERKLNNESKSNKAIKAHKNKTNARKNKIKAMKGILFKKRLHRIITNNFKHKRDEVFRKVENNRIKNSSSKTHPPTRKSEKNKSNQLIMKESDRKHLEYVIDSKQKILKQSPVTSVFPSSGSNTPSKDSRDVVESKDKKIYVYRKENKDITKEYSDREIDFEFDDEYNGNNEKRKNSKSLSELLEEEEEALSRKSRGGLKEKVEKEKVIDGRKYILYEDKSKDKKKKVFNDIVEEI